MTYTKPTQRGEYAPAHPDELYLEACFRGALVSAILKEAQALDRRPIDLVADVIEAVFLNDLVRAVLDE
jgi:hypothetical protein